jgi:hypothetical protein
MARVSNLIGKTFAVKRMKKPSLVISVSVSSASSDAGGS